MLKGYRSAAENGKFLIGIACALGIIGAVSTAVMHIFAANSASDYLSEEAYMQYVSAVATSVAACLLLALYIVKIIFMFRKTESFWRFQLGCSGVIMFLCGVCVLGAVVYIVVDFSAPILFGIGGGLFLLLCAAAVEVAGNAMFASQLFPDTK